MIEFGGKDSRLKQSISRYGNPGTVLTFSKTSALIGAAGWAEFVWAVGLSKTIAKTNYRWGPSLLEIVCIFVIITRNHLGGRFFGEAIKQTSRIAKLSTFSPNKTPE